MADEQKVPFYIKKSNITTVNDLNNFTNYPFANGTIYFTKDHYIVYDYVNANGANTRARIGAARNNSVYFVEDVEATVAGNWLGIIDEEVTQLYDGLTILFVPKVAGTSSSTARTLTNDDGSTISATYTWLKVSNSSLQGVWKKCYYNTSNLTTHFAVNTLICLTYRSSLNSGAGGWQALVNYDANDPNYRTREYYMRPYAAQAIYRYKLVAMDKDNRVVPLVTTNQSNATIVAKTQTTKSFKPDAIYYYASTTTVNAGAVMTANTLYSQYGDLTTCVYTFNENVPTYRAVYLVGAYNETTGLFTLDQTNNTSWYKFVPTNTADITLSSYFASGKYYILLGYTYSSNNYLDLLEYNTLYYFDGTNLVPVAYRSGTTNNKGQVKLVSGNVGNKTYVDGEAAAAAHTHSQYLTSDKYHVSGSWNNLKYTATAKNSAEELSFTLPTGTTSTTVALGNHSHTISAGTGLSGGGSVANDDSITLSLAAHASSATTYGVGTTLNYGHNKLVSGALALDRTYVDGEAAAAAHTHTGYLTSHQTMKYRPIKMNAIEILSNTSSDALTLSAGTGISLASSATGIITITNTVTNTNYYHKTGSWDGLTYTAAKVGSPEDLAFTIPTGTTATTVAAGNHIHTITAGSGLNGGGNVANGGSITINHSNSITAKTVAAQAAKTLTWGGTFTIYEEKYDAQGHITGVASYNMTMPSNPNTDQYVLQNAVITTNKNYPIILGYDDRTTAVTGEVNKTSTLLYNPSTQLLTTSKITVNNTAIFNGSTTINELTVGNMQVTGTTHFSVIPTAPTAADNTNDTTLATTEFVHNAFRTNDAMIFKGVVDASHALPNTHYQGWTYKVASAGTYAGQTCEVGDTIYCVTDGTSADNSHWVAVQNNINGAIFKGSNTFTGGKPLVTVSTQGQVKEGTVTNATVIKTINQANSTSNIIGTVSNGVLTLSQAITAVGAVTVTANETVIKSIS